DRALLSTRRVAYVVGRAQRLQRPVRQLDEELAERGSCEATAPELAGEPIADVATALGRPAEDVARGLAVHVDHPDHGALVREDPAPVLVERRAVAARDAGHRRGLGVGLLLEERV